MAEVPMGFEVNNVVSEGREVQPNGHVYEGDFKNGIKDGYGKLIYPDGSHYEGDFK
jgi:hypothetical protein